MLLHFSCRDVNLDHLAEAVAAKVLHGEVTISLFVIKNTSEDILWDYVNMIFLLELSLTLASSVGLACNNYYLDVCLMVILYILYSLYIY